MRFSTVFLYVAASVPFTLASVSLTVPAAGASVPNTGFTVTWAESGDAPSITDITGYTLYLYTGPNTAPVPVGPALASGTSPTPSSFTVQVDPTLSGETENA